MKACIKSGIKLYFKFQPSNVAFTSRLEIIQFSVLTAGWGTSLSLFLILHLTGKIHPNISVRTVSMTQTIIVQCQASDSQG